MCLYYGIGISFNPVYDVLYLSGTQCFLADDVLHCLPLQSDTVYGQGPKHVYLLLLLCLNKKIKVTSQHLLNLNPVYD